MNYNGPSEIDPRNHEEILKLIKKSQQGDKVATDLVVRANVGLVASIVKKFLNRGYEYEDLFQIGCIGLIKSVKNFNPDYNVKFSTYAVPMIIGEIKRFLRDDGLVKVSRNMKDIAKKVKVAKEKLIKELGREAKIEEIANEIGISSEDVVLSIESMETPDYLYDTIHQDDGSPIMLIDKLSEEKESNSDITDSLALKELICKLDPKSRQVIILRYFKDMTQSQIAEILGISQVQVSRIEKRVIEYLRKSMV